MARPKIKIDADQVEKLAILGCSNVDIAYVLDVSVDTLARRFAEIINKGRAKRRTKLRQLMWQSAEKGNVAILIFLAKNVLAMTDTPAHEGVENEKTEILENYARIGKG